MPSPRSNDRRRQSALSGTPRTRLNRNKDRTVTDRAMLTEILEQGMFCHLGVVVDGAPLVMPTAYGVDLSPTAPDAPDGTLYVHGSVAAKSLVASPEQTVCVTVTHVDGLVLARSGFHHSVNYRSAMVLARPRLVTGDAKHHALDLIVEHLVPGRTTALRPPTRKDLAATTVLALPLTEVSVKMRSGAVSEEESDIGLPIWAGVMPLRMVADPPQTSDDCAEPVPDHVLQRAADLA
ncbi:MAG: pyridoxamine 5'-phosphate oxidase family protein [Streptosporangiales bacterium]|nr:pyridoxamine 5'-phosphate oxidase family protein [Streptosporangiales bacterium]